MGLRLGFFDGVVGSSIVLVLQVGLGLRSFYGSFGGSMGEVYVVMVLGLRGRRGVCMVRKWKW